MSKPQFAVGAGASSGARPSMIVDDRVHVLALVEGLATAEVASTCILLWRAQVTETRFQFQKEALEYITSQYPGEASVLCVIEPTSEPPSQELRQAAGNLLRAVGPKMRALAFVIEGSGFRAAMIRGVLSSIEMLKRDKLHPTRYFANVAHAAMWLETLTKNPAPDVIYGATHLRERMNSLYQTRQSMRASGSGSIRAPRTY